MPLNSNGELKYDMAQRIQHTCLVLYFLVCFIVLVLEKKKKRIFMFADVDQSYIATSLVATVHNTRVVCMIVSFFNPLLCPPPLYFPSFYFANRVDKLWCVFDSHTESFVIPRLKTLSLSLSLLFSFMSRNH